MAHRRSAKGESLSVEGSLDSDLVTGQILVVNGRNSAPTREWTDPRPAMAIFGVTTEIQSSQGRIDRH